MNKELEMLKGKLGHINKPSLEEALEMLEDISKEEIVVRDRSTVYMNPNDNGKGAFTHLTTVGVNFKGAIETIKETLLKAKEQENENSEYKKLEEEIGCPLKVLFKALKNGIYKYMYFDINNPVFRHFDELDTDGEFLFFEYLKHDTYGQEENGDVYLKDYMKTWWLKEDRSE